VTGGWGRLHNEELVKAYTSPNIVRMRWTGHVARMGKMRKAYSISVGKPENLGVDGNIILEWILGKVWTGCIWLRIGTSGGLCDYQFLKKDSFPWSWLW
jgi:hypothetical protein